MTDLRSFVIHKGSTSFIRLNEMTPADMSFSSQINMAVDYYVESADKPENKLPALDAPLDEWADYMVHHPEYAEKIGNRARQLEKLSKRGLYAIR